MMIEVSHIPGRVALGHSLRGRCPFSRLVSFGLPPAFCRGPLALFAVPTPVG